jgi:hypothetical protein
VYAILNFMVRRFSFVHTQPSNGQASRSLEDLDRTSATTFRHPGQVCPQIWVWWPPFTPAVWKLFKAKRLCYVAAALRSFPQEKGP